MWLTSIFSILILLDVSVIKANSQSSLTCPNLVVSGAEYADCDGDYREEERQVDWARDRPVYKHANKDRYIFWNNNGVGWSIGKEDYLSNGAHWHKSGSDSVEPWQDPWEGGVTVKCAQQEAGKCCDSVEISSTGEALRDQPTYMGVYTRRGEGYNSRPVYSKVKGKGARKLFIYYFTSQTHSVSLWVVGPKVGQFSAGIRNRDESSCVNDLKGKWKFAARSGVWSDSDPSLTIKCYNFATEGRFESRRIRPKVKAPPSARTSQSRKKNYKDIALEQSRNIDRRKFTFDEVSEEPVTERQRDCFWSEWGDWSRCSKSCGQGSQTRVRKVEVRARGEGRRCRGGKRERIGCNIIDCRAPATTTTKRTTTTTRRTTRRTTTTTRRTTRRTVRTTRRLPIRSTTQRTTRTIPTKPKRIIRPPRDVQCWQCGSLFSTDNPDCEKFDKEDPSQLKTCDKGHACLYYSYEKADSEFETIRECFPTSILLGSIDNPIVPAKVCRPKPVDSDSSIQACICTTDFCSGIEGEIFEKSSGPDKTFEHFPERPAISDERNQEPETVHSPGRKVEQEQPRRTDIQQSQRRINTDSFSELDRRRIDKDDTTKVLSELETRRTENKFERGRGKTEAVSKQEWRSNEDASQWNRRGNEDNSRWDQRGNEDTSQWDRRGNEDTSQWDRKLNEDTSQWDKTSNNDVSKWDRNRNEDASKLERTRSEGRSDFDRSRNDEFFEQESPRSDDIPEENAIRSSSGREDNGPRRVLCHQCGQLFSRGGNTVCQTFDQEDPEHQGYCQEGEACLWYSWQKSRSTTAYIRECFSKSALLGSLENHLVVRSTCQPQDISENRLSKVSACLCDSDLCNLNHNEEELSTSGNRAPRIESKRQDKSTHQSQRSKPENEPKERNTKKQEEADQNKRQRQPGIRHQKELSPSRIDTTPGLQCFSCGSLFNPDKLCDQFDRTNVTHAQTCLKGEACLKYTWEKSASETASLRECFPTRVLLGSIANPLTPSTRCDMRDITDDGSGSIKACLCQTDYCNDNLIEEEEQQHNLIEDVFEDNTVDSFRREETQHLPTTRKPVLTTTKTIRTTKATFQRTTEVTSTKESTGHICPPDFIPVKNDCFFISKERAGWIQAKKRCEQKGEGGRLASLESKFKISRLLGFVSKSTRRKGGSYWLAGNDIYIEGRWEWDGADIIADDSYSLVPRDWGWLDPDYQQSDEENCLSWTVRFGFGLGDQEGGWQGASCCNSLPYICQI